MKAKYFYNLDALRSIAFLMVFFSHAVDTNLKSLIFDNNQFINIFSGIFNLGREGVSVFFVLSGFLITYLLLFEHQKKQKISLWNFYVRRTLRIWPLFYFVVIYALFLHPLLCHFIGIPFSQNGNILKNLLFLNNFDLIHLIESNNIDFNPQLQITWSVAIEEQFYLAWPILVIFFIKIGRLSYFFPLIIFLSFIFRLNNNEIHNYFNSLSAFGDLALGGWIAYLITNNLAFKNVFNRMKDSIRIIIYCLGVIFLLNKSFFETNLSFILFRYLSTSLYAFIIIDQCYNKSTKFKLSNFKLLSKMGQYTYGLYLLHPIVIVFLKHTFDFLNYSYQRDIYIGIVFFMLSFSISLILSYLSYHYFESLFLKIKAKFVSY